MFASLNVLTVPDKICQGKCLVNSVIVRFELRTVSFMGRGSVVSIATRYELEGLGLESRECEIFGTYPDRPWCSSSLVYY
jgi:hypothetical protein